VGYRRIVVEIVVFDKIEMNKTAFRRGAENAEEMRRFFGFLRDLCASA
jgi:hypothetical protein